MCKPRSSFASPLVPSYERASKAMLKAYTPPSSRCCILDIIYPCYI